MTKEFKNILECRFFVEQDLLVMVNEMRQAADRDDFQGKAQWKTEDGYIAVVNPRYHEARFELETCGSNGLLSCSLWPFRVETKEDVQAFYAGKPLIDLAVPILLVTRPDGTTYESW